MTAVPVLVSADAMPAWRALSAALGTVQPPCASNPDAWFAKDATPAVAACQQCHAITECGQFAAASGERHGVWGGRQLDKRSHGVRVGSGRA